MQKEPALETPEWTEWDDERSDLQNDLDNVVNDVESACDSLQL